MIGQTLGHYRLVERIGAGGMGEVYRARDEHLDRDVAVKLLPSGLLADEAARKRFRKEALALAKLNHPNIATVHDFAAHDGVDVLVTEYVPGQSLNERLSAGPLEEKEVLRLGQQLAEGLAAAHAEGVVHRDLKPANLQVTREGRLKILDFGVARLLRRVDDAAATETVTEAEAGALAGTLPYMAPEQLRGEPADARTDIWAAGAVLYEMATGRRPFEARLSTALAADIQHKPPAPPRQLNPKFSPRLEEIILKCMEKDPENRYQSAKELAVDLRRLALPGTGVAPAAATAAAAQRRRWKIGLAAAAAVVALVVLAVALNVGGLREALRGSAAAPRIESLAVLPLKNLMGDAEQDYFVEGMHEALTAELSKISALKVISRTSSMRYKDTDKPLPQVARELGVAGLIEGSVLREGDQVRITVQLIHGPSDRYLWGESYQRELRGMLALQSAVARAIAREIKITVTPAEATRLAHAGTVNSEAQDLYLRGRYYANQWTEEGKKNALSLFQQAVEKDPTHALAYVGIADAYAILGSWDKVLLPPNEAMPKSKAAALKALEIDDTLGEAHTSLAYAKFHYDWDWTGAEQEFTRALVLSPSYAPLYHWYSHLLMALGRMEESLAASKRALEIDPLDPETSVHLAWHYVHARQEQQAIEALRRALELDPYFAEAHTYLGRAYLLLGKHAEAIRALQDAVAFSGGDVHALKTLGYAYGAAGKREEAQKVLDELIQRMEDRYVSPFDIAVVAVGMGHKQEAVRWLERAYRERAGGLVYLKVDPEMDSLRGDPRFQDLLRRMNFPQ